MTSIGVAWTQARATRRTRPARTPMLVMFVTWLARVLPSWRRARTTVMQLAGFAFLDFAAWQWSMLAGCVAVGVSLFVLEALSGGGDRR